MSPRFKLVVAVLGACAVLIALLAAVAIVALAGQPPETVHLVEHVLEHRLGAMLAVGFLGCGFLIAIVRALHESLVLAPARVAEEAAALLDEPGRQLAAQGPAELRRLIAAVNRLALQHAEAETRVQERMRAANANAEAERNRFAALVAELAQGVVVCNLDGRILLYNRRARELFAPPDGQAPPPLGLGRSIYALFDEQLIAYALEKVRGHYGSASAQARHLVAAPGSGRLLRVDLAPVQGARTPTNGAEGDCVEDLPGFIMLLEDVTAMAEGESRRDLLLQELTQGIRGSLGNLRAAGETLHDYPDMSVQERERFVTVLRDEAQRVGARVEAAARRFAALLEQRMPLEEMRAADLLAAAHRRIEQRTGVTVTLADPDPALWVKVDGFSMLQALTYLVSRLRDAWAVRQVWLQVASEGQMARLDLTWAGGAMNTETVLQWELEPMNAAGESTPLTVRDVIERCGGEVWFQRDRPSQRASFRFLVPAIAAPGRLVRTQTPGDEAADSRPEFYDFDLFRRFEAGGEAAALADLSYTVFDTETTGLDPSAGDEIIQIGAVRIVNRRVLRRECFEQLVDPRRSLPSASIRIHGITPGMLVGQPPIDRVLPVFRAYVADTVLVAHNAAFDMRFLELKTASAGVVFDRPVLDTFLLSAVLFPNQESHRLELIAERLGVPVSGRHTALGDAIITAEVFVRMLGLLAERGIRTLGQAQEASEQTYHARIRY